SALAPDIGARSATAATATSTARWKRIGTARIIIIAPKLSKRLSYDRSRPFTKRRSQNLSDPVVRVGRAAVLDVNQLLAQPHGDGTGRAAADEKIAASGTHLADRRDDGGRAAGKSLLQLSAGGISAPLLDRVGLLAHRPAGILRERDDRIAGDAR